MKDSKSNAQRQHIPNAPLEAKAGLLEGFLFGGSPARRVAAILVLVLIGILLYARHWFTNTFQHVEVNQILSGHASLSSPQQDPAKLAQWHQEVFNGRFDRMGAPQYGYRFDFGGAALTLLVFGFDGKKLDENCAKLALDDFRFPCRDVSVFGIIGFSGGENVAGLSVSDGGSGTIEANGQRYPYERRNLDGGVVQLIISLGEGQVALVQMPEAEFSMEKVIAAF
jgi:hypothetical protein